MSDPRRILIVDDEPLARQRVSRYLKQSGRSLVVEAAATGLEAVERIREFEPDIVFLDVEMPGLSGFEVLQQFDERPFHVVFQTAYDEFALRAFEEHACDYLLKPFTPERFLESLDRALSRVADEERLRALEAAVAERDGYLRRLSVKQGGKLRIVEDKEIACFVSRDHYTCVYFDGSREAITDLSLARLVERLDPAAFKQLHRNNIVRVSEIVSLSNNRDGSMWVELTNGMKLPVSRSRRRHARELVKALAG
ncbi:MAG: LytTR family DNA-binding domain-containing protein [Blastocatellia bacterium]|nr:LytTR family DNA-binding domain-containing protein [Blastocatellia bacterium]